MPLNLNTYKKLFELLWKDPIYVALCLQAARMFQQPISSIKPLPHETAELMRRTGISQADAVSQLQYTMRDVRLQFLGFLQEYKFD